jgi:hypothetical protein
MKKTKKKTPLPARKSRRRVAAEKGIGSKGPYGDARPHLDFLNWSPRIFPETITKSDLETLNLGLRFLFSRLREAKQQYDENRDGGRAAASMALGAMWQYITLFDLPRTELLHLPILKLQNALAALDQNNVLPMLKPVSHPGRAASSDDYLSLQGHAAATMMRLRKLGSHPKQACALVATELAKIGVRPQRGANTITGSTVRHWCDDIENDVGRHGTAAFIYDTMFTDEENKRFGALPPVKAMLLALASLRLNIQAMFPELRLTPEKPSYPPI